MSHFVTHLGTPLKVRHTSLIPRFLVVQKNRQNPLYEISLNGSRGFCSAVLFGVFIWKVLSEVVFVRFPSVRIPPLQQ